LGVAQVKDDIPKNLMPLDERSRHLRRQIVRVLEGGGRGHIGTSLSLVEMLRVLFDSVLRYDPKNPRWPERDRFILSKGHGCITLYVLLQEKGFFAEEELRKFCRFDGILGGHPDPKVPGIEVSTGSLGHGLPVAVGMAVAAKRSGATHRVVTVLGDGECDEGSVWEAAMSASKHQLDNLTVIVDYNKQQSYGTTYEVLDLEPFAAKWEAFGFATKEVDGHDVPALERMLAALPFAKDRPSAVICHTVKGKGISFAENNLKWHHKSSLKNNEVEELLRAIEASE
jgi:transketolase